MILCI